MWLRTASKAASVLLRANGDDPVTSSNSRMPRAKRSLRPSIAPPSTCSGLMYPRVPTTNPAWVSVGGPFFASSLGEGAAVCG